MHHLPNHFTLNVTVPPNGEPVTPADVRAQSRIDANADDPLISLYISAARRQWEVWTRKALMTQQLRYTLDRFPIGLPYSYANPYRAIYLPRPPLVSVQSIQYIAPDGSLQTWNSSNYIVDVYSQPGRITAQFGAFFPVTLPIANSVIVNYTAGFGTAADVPPTSKLGIIQLCAHLYENREPYSAVELKEIPMHLQSLIALDSAGTYP